MKIFYEEKINAGKDNETIEAVLEVPTIEQAEALKSEVKDSYYHLCYHDERVMRPCRRVKL